MQISAGSDLTLFSRAMHDAIWFELSGAVHTSFDGYYWYWSLDAPATSRADEQCNLTVRAYMLSFLDKYLKGQATTLHEGPSPEHPRVVNYRRK
jgi:hypothetical protein